MPSQSQAKTKSTTAKAPPKATAKKQEPTRSANPKDEQHRAVAERQRQLQASAKEVDANLGHAENPVPRDQWTPAVGVENPNPALRLPDLPIDASPLRSQGYDDDDSVALAQDDDDLPGRDADDLTDTASEDAAATAHRNEERAAANAPAVVPDPDAPASDH